MYPTDQPKTLANGFSGGRFRLDRYFLWVSQVPSCNLFDRFWHGCRKQGGLACFRRLLENPFDFVDEAHAEHFVSFIQNQSLHFVEFQSALANVIRYSPGSTHNHVHATLEAADLACVILSTIDGQNLKSLDLPA